MLSESRCKEIHLQIVKTLSVLIINISNKVTLYYLLSNNFINKIINTINEDFIKYDEDFLSYYVNFLKSISLKIDLTTLQFFFMSKTNSFPLFEVALSLYNHEDKMIQSVVKNILLIMLKLNYPPLIEYLSTLPTLSYFVFISCRIKNLLLLLSKEKNYEQYKTLQEDIVEEIIFIQDIFILKIDKINHIISNSLFHYCILPYIINTKFDKIQLNIKLYFINVLFTIIQDEDFLNILFTILFFPFQIVEIKNFINNIPVEPDNYFYSWKEKNNNIHLSSSSFSNYIKYNYNKNSINNIMSSKNSKFPEFNQIKNKLNNINNNKNADKQKIIINEICEYFSPEEKASIVEYHKNLSIGTGINCGFCIDNENKGETCDKCFKNFMEKFYIIFFDKNLNFKNKLLPNNFKDYLFYLINIKQRKNNILFSICLLMRNIIIKNNDRISKLLLKEVKFINGNNLNENEIKDISKVIKDEKLEKKILLNEQFKEVEEDEDDDDDDEDFNEIIIENREKKKLITDEQNIKIKNSIFLTNNNNNKNKFKNFDIKYFENMGKIISDLNKNNISNDMLYFYNNNLIETFLDLLILKNNLNPFLFKCIIDNIMSLITINRKNENDINRSSKPIILASSLLKLKIEKVYNEYKAYIINNYKTNKNFNLYAYNKFKNQYQVFLLLLNYDYDNLIKEGDIILSQHLLNYNNEYTKGKITIFDKDYFDEEERKKDILNHNIVNFFIIHDCYYKISNDTNLTEKDLFEKYYPLNFDELEMNKQYFLCDLSSDITYFSCKCKITTTQKKYNNNYFDCTLILFETKIYIGNSPSNPNYTRLIDKYSCSNCSVEKSLSVDNCIDLFIASEENNDFIEIEIIITKIIDIIRIIDK